VKSAYENKGAMMMQLTMKDKMGYGLEDTACGFV